MRGGTSPSGRSSGKVEAQSLHFAVRVMRPRTTHARDHCERGFPSSFQAVRGLRGGCRRCAAWMGCGLLASATCRPCFVPPTARRFSRHRALLVPRVCVTGCINGGSSAVFVFGRQRERVIERLGCQQELRHCYFGPPTQGYVLPRCSAPGITFVGCRTFGLPPRDDHCGCFRRRFVQVECDDPRAAVHAVRGRAVRGGVGISGRLSQQPSRHDVYVGDVAPER
jgi:hypothetical protein